MSRLLLPFLAVFAIAGHAAAADLQLVKKYSAGIAMDGIRNIVPYELPPEAHPRLLVMTNYYFMGLQWSTQQNAYEQAFFVEGDFDKYAAVADFDGDGVNDLVVAVRKGSSDGQQLVAYDRRTGALVRSLPLDITAAAVRGLAAQNLDDTPGNELLLTDGRGVAAYKAGALFWRNEVPSVQLVTAQADSRPDAVFGGISSLATQDVVRLDPRTGAELQRSRLPCVEGGVIGQADADPGLELACNVYAGGADLFDLDSGALQWSYRLGGNPTMLDVNGDGYQDVVMRSDFRLAVVNGITGQPFHEPRVLERGLTVPILAGCTPMLVVASNTATSAADTIELVDPLTLETKGPVQTLVQYGPRGLAIADFDGDGHNEVLLRYDGRVSAMTFQPPHKGPELARGEGCCYGAGITAGQLDADPALEYVIGDTESVSGDLEAYDGVTHELMWVAPLDDGEAALYIEIADIDGDGRNEVLAASDDFSSAAKGTFVYCFDGATGKPRWRSVNIPGLTGRIRIADMNGDGAPEVLAISRFFGIVRMDAATGRVRAFDEFKDGGDFVVVNTDRDPEPEIVATAGSSPNFSLFILDGGVRVREVAGVVGYLETGDVDGDGVDELLLFRTFSTEVRAADTLQPRWTLENPPSAVPYNLRPEIRVADVDDDGTPELVVLRGLTLTAYGVEPRPADATPPRFAPGSRLGAETSTRAACCSVTVSLHWDAAEPDDSSPLVYQVWRSAPGQADMLLGSTTRTEFEDGAAAGATPYRYAVRVVDAAGNAADADLSANVVTPATQCQHRRAARR